MTIFEADNEQTPAARWLPRVWSVAESVWVVAAFITAMIALRSRDDRWSDASLLLLLGYLVLQFTLDVQSPQTSQLMKRVSVVSGGLLLMILIIYAVVIAVS